MIKPPPRYVKFRPSKLNLGRSFLEDFKIVSGLNDSSGSKSGANSESSNSSNFHYHWPFTKSYMRVSSPTSTFHLIPKWLKSVSSSPLSPKVGWWATTSNATSDDSSLNSKSTNSWPSSHNGYNLSSSSHQFRCYPKNVGGGAIWMKYNFTDGSSLRNLREEEERYRKDHEANAGSENEETVIDLISLKKMKKVKKNDKDESKVADSTGIDVEGDMDTVTSPVSKPILSSRGAVSSGSDAGASAGAGAGAGTGASSGDDSGHRSSGKSEAPPPLSKRQRKKARATAPGSSSRLSNEKAVENTKVETVSQSVQVNSPDVRKAIKVPTRSTEDLDESLDWSRESISTLKETGNRIVGDNSYTTEPAASNDAFIEQVPIKSTEREPAHISQPDAMDQVNLARPQTAGLGAAEDPLEVKDSTESIESSKQQFDPQSEPVIVDEKLFNETSLLSNNTHTVQETNTSSADQSPTDLKNDLLKGLQLKEKYNDASKDFERLLSLVEAEKYDSDKKQLFLKPLKYSPDQVDDVLPNDIRSNYPTSTSYAGAPSTEAPPTNGPTSSPAPAPSPLLSVSSIPLESEDIRLLQDALKEAKADEEKHAQEMFRIENALEYTKSISSKRPRSIESGNFFTPVNRSSLKPLTPKGVAYEYIIVTPNQKFIRTRTLPFKDDNPRRDLFSALSEMPDPARYVKTIAKLEKSNWKCIGGGGPGRLLVFERQYNPFKRFTKFLLKFTGSFISIVTVAALVAVTIESPFTAV